MMKEGDNSHGIAAAVYDDCFYLATEFPKVQFEHAYREANAVAPELARLDHGPNQQVWLDNPPACIIPLLADDVTIIINK